MDQEDVEIEPIEDIRVDSFDWGTRVSRMSDGSVRLRVPSMPPSWATQPFDSFQDDLARAIGVKVEGLDRELFSVPKPADDTVDRIVSFLASVRARN